MKYAYSDEQLLPLCNPSYWDGHILGQTGPEIGANTSGVTALDDLITSVSQLRGWHVLRSQVTHINVDWPSRHLVEGQTFDPNDYQPQTIVSLCRETVSMRKNGAETIRLGDMNFGEAPTRPLYKPNLERGETNSRVAISPNIMYGAIAMMGVITQRRQSNELVCLYDKWISVQDNRTRSFIPFLPAEPHTIPVGKTVTYETRAPERVGTQSTRHFARYNYIDVHQPQRNNRRGRRIIDLLPKLAIGELPTTAGAEA